MGERRALGRHRALDLVVDVRVPAALAPVLGPALADLGAPDVVATDHLDVQEVRAGGGRVAWTMSWDGEVVATYDDPDGVVAGVVNVLSDRAAAALLATHAVVHAATVEVDGAAVLCVGASGAGKSTLAAAAALGGLGYVADEIGAVGDAGVVRAFHRPVGLRAGGAAALGVEVPPGPFAVRYPFAVGAVGRLSPDAPLGHIALLARHDGPPERIEVGPAPALFALSRQTLGGPRGPGGSVAFRRLEALVRRVPAVELRYADPGAGVELLRGLTRSGAPIGP